jgi:FixJ family two-component response regulator
MISIVDDDESVRDSTEALVRSLGYAARTFASAEEFLESDLDKTSCLILDVQMKGLSGIELQKRLIADGRQTPIIFITAYADERIRNGAIADGAIGFLRKPVNDESLIRHIDAALVDF